MFMFPETKIFSLREKKYKYKIKELKHLVILILNKKKCEFTIGYV